jgi:hypothetical protein
MKSFATLSLLTASLLSAHAEVDLINIDYTGHLNPFFFTKTGPAAVGNDPSDFWNVYSRDVSNQFDWRDSGTVSDLKYSDGTSSEANLAVFNAMGAWYTLEPDAMYQSYLYPLLNPANPLVSELTDLPQGHYDIYVYAHGQPANENAILTLLNGAQNLGSKSTSADAAADSPGFTEGFEYVVFHDVAVAPGDKLTLLSTRDQSDIPMINGIQLLSVPEGGATLVGGIVMAAMCGFARWKNRPV